MDQIKDMLPHSRRQINPTLIGVIVGAALLAVVALFVYPRYGRRIGQAVSETGSHLVDRAKSMAARRRGSHDYGAHRSYRVGQALERENEILESGHTRVDDL